MKPIFRLIGLLLLWMCGVGCRTARHASTYTHTQLDTDMVSMLHHSCDSLYRHDLTGEIEWEWLQITYPLDTLCDTLVPCKSVTRLRRTLRISDREEQRVVDTLVSTREEEVHRKTEERTRECRRQSASTIIPTIALILILFLIYKLN